MVELCREGCVLVFMENIFIFQLCDEPGGQGGAGGRPPDRLPLCGGHRLGVGPGQQQNSTLNSNQLKNRDKGVAPACDTRIAESLKLPQILEQRLQLVTGLQCSDAHRD